MSHLHSVFRALHRGKPQYRDRVTCRDASCGRVFSDSWSLLRHCMSTGHEVTGYEAAVGPAASPTSSLLSDDEYLIALQDACHSVDTLADNGFIFLGEESPYEAFPIWSFEEAPEPDPAAKPKRKAVALDCQMLGVRGDDHGVPSHATVGRLTAVDALTGEVLIDHFVNTRPHPVNNYRNINEKEYNEAIRTNAPNIYDHWYYARDALFQHVDSETILIGHVLREDLCVLRISHARCVDSMLLAQQASARAGFPKGNEFSLKTLTEAFLGRDVQASPEISEPSSPEHTLAAMDLVRCFVEDPRRLDEYMEGKWARIVQEFELVDWHV